MRRALILTLLAGTTLLAPAAAPAEGIYFVAKLGSSDAQVDVSGAFNDVLDGDDNSSSFGLGFRVGRNLAFQAEYHDLGKVPGFSGACPFEGSECVIGLPLEADSTAVSVSVLPHLLLTRRVRAYAKLGYISWDTDISAVSDAGSQFLDELSEEEFVYGAGLRLELPGPIDAFAEYERIADSFETIAIGGTWGF